MTTEELVTILQDASGAIYMAENWAISLPKLHQLCKARRQLQDAIKYLNDGNKIEPLDPDKGRVIISKD